VGLGRTGMATARFLAGKGVRLKISEARPAMEVEAARKALGDLPAEWEWGGHTPRFFAEADLIVVSPGVPMDVDPLVQARAEGIPVISEMELAFPFLRRPMIGITGTNGKTTTTTLVGEMLRAAGRKVFVGGNIGNPLIAYVDGPQEEDWIVVEISSFQLEGIVNFRAHLSVLLNITEDHLDRYAHFQDYIQAKGKIFQNQKKDDYALLNADDPLAFQFAHRIESQVILFSSQRRVPVGCFLEKGAIVFQGGDGAQEKFGLERLKIRGIHNWENLMAAIGVAKICGCPREPLQKVMEDFPGLEHRLEWVRNMDGISFFNDSKGTNVGSVVKSLLSFEEPVFLIAGVKDKGGDYGPLKSIVRSRVKGMVLIGEAKKKMFAALGHLTETLQVNTLEEAVHWAASKASAGDVVLLSPACSSFDMFENYQERGKRFKAIVRELSSQKQESKFFGCDR